MNALTKTVLLTLMLIGGAVGIASIREDYWPGPFDRIEDEEHWLSAYLAQAERPSSLPRCKEPWKHSASLPGGQS